MTLAGHKKHAAIARPNQGTFGRNELGIVGAPCAHIQALAGKLITVLEANYKMAYVDARHNEEADSDFIQPAAITCTGTATGAAFVFQGELNAFQYRKHFNGADLVLVNGNHYAAKQQIVIIDGKKKQSLQKRLDQLTDVRLFLLAEGETEIFDFLKENIPNYQNIPVYRLNEVDEIISLVEILLKQAKPALNGLVLAGGKSLRMGTHKGAINWHGQPQQYYMANLLKGCCNEVYISCRQDQQPEIDPDYKTLPDTFTGLGPYGAILSAFREKPDTAWLVVACDLPLLDRSTLAQLTSARSVQHIATTFQSPYDSFPEPLITIWEPKSYPELLAFLAQGYSCPRKVLINSDTHIINAANADALTNVNTPEELERVKAMLQPKINA